jgi:DNA gyrase subunit A
MGRATQGVRLINLRNNDEIAAVTKVSADIIETEDELLDETEMSDNEQIVEGIVEGQETGEAIANEETDNSEE